MDSSGNYTIYHAIDEKCNEYSDEESGNDDTSESFDIFNPDETENCQFLQLDNTNQSRNMNRRILNYVGPMGFFSRHNKSMKRILTFFGLTTTLILFTQLYLSSNYEYSLEGLFEHFRFKN